MKKAINIIKIIIGAIGTVLGALFIMKQIEDSADEEIDDLKDKNGTLTGKNKVIKTEIGKTSAKIDDVDDEIDALKDEIDTLKPEDPKNTNLDDFFKKRKL
jgi:peptidoglycan hydrolase CwlO-like protein